MVHIAPYGGYWTYAAGKAAVAKMFDYLQDQHPEWHIVQIQPGVIRTGLNEKFGAISQDEREYSNGRWGPKMSVRILLTCDTRSRAPSSIPCVAGLT